MHALAVGVCGMWCDYQQYVVTFVWVSLFHSFWLHSLPIHKMPYAQHYVVSPDL